MELNLDALDLTSVESKTNYDEIKAYVLKKHNLTVFSLYIFQVKRKCGMDVNQENVKAPQCFARKGRDDYGCTETISNDLMQNHG